MRGSSAVASLAVHLALGVAVLLGPAKPGHLEATPPPQLEIMFPPIAQRPQPDGLGGVLLPEPIAIASVELSRIPAPSLPEAGAIWRSLATSFSSSEVTGGTVEPPGWGGALIEQEAEVLSGPLPAYPELMLQAGVQGRVVIEAVVDKTGRIVASSIQVVSTTNPAFVAPARQALLATLFRPALVGGKAVQMRIRMPYEFTIRNGMGRAR